jgi:hypothetical protein
MSPDVLTAHPAGNVEKRDFEGDGLLQISKESSESS